MIFMNRLYNRPRGILYIILGALLGAIKKA